MKIIITEEQKKKLFIPRKLSKDDSRYSDHNNSQPIKNIDGKDIRINQYDYEGRKQGYWEEYYGNGQLDSKGSYVNGEQEGYWEEYWSNGQLNSKGSYNNGKPDGYWEEYYDNGQLWYKGSYKNGEMEGYWEKYYSDGQLWYKGSYNNGNKDGYWEIYYEDGQLEYRGSYVNGKFIGDLNESEKKKKLFIPRRLNPEDSRYSEHNNKQPIKNIDGKEIRINQYDYDGRKQGYWEEYYDNGQLMIKGSYVNDVKEGYWEEYWSNGQLNFKGSYNNGNKDGYWEWYFPNGKLEYKGIYKNGKFIGDLNESEKKKKLFIPRRLNPEDSRYSEHNNKQPIKNINGKDIRINQYDYEGRKQGYWEDYYDNGQLMIKGSYVNDVKEGYWERYYDNGQLFSKGSYKNDKPDGYWEYYYSNGQLRYKGSYVNGLMEGYWEEYYDNGELWSKGSYKNGERDGYWEGYWRNGQLRYKGTYKNGLMEGYWEEYYSDGQLESRGSYVNGKLIKGLNEGQTYPYKLNKFYNLHKDGEIVYEFTNKDGYDFEVSFINMGHNNWEREYKTTKKGLGVINTNDVYNIIETVTNITIDFIEKYQPDNLAIIHIKTRRELNMSNKDNVSKRALINKKYLQPAINKLDNYYYKLIGSKSIISKI